MPQVLPDRYETKYNSATYTLYLRIYDDDGETILNEVHQSRSSSASSVSVSKTIPDETPTKSGYTFLGYAIQDKDNEVSKQPGNTISTTFSRQTTGSSQSSYYDADGTRVHVTTYSCADQWRRTSLYAKWELLGYNVIYDANGGTGAPDQQLKEQDVALTLSSVEPTREDYVFAGWATSPSGPASYQPGDSYTANANVTLYAVWEPAGSALTVPSSVEINSSFTASWGIVDPTNTYVLKLTCGDSVAVSPTISAGTSSYSFPVPPPFLNRIPNATSAQATVTLVTKSGDTVVGQSSRRITLLVPDSVVPTISSFTATPYSEDATVTGWGVFVQGLTKADLAVSSSAGSGASITSISFSGPGVNQTGAGTTARSDTLSVSGSNTFTVTVADSRGRTATATVTINVFTYGIPAVFAITTMRADSDGTINNSAGTHLKVYVFYSKSSVDGHNNFVTQTLSYSNHGSSTPIATINCASNTWYGPPDHMWPINLSDAYDVTVTIEDSLGNGSTTTVTLPPAQGIWYGRSNDRLGLGAAPPGAGLYCDWEAHFLDDVSIAGDLGVTGASTFGDDVSVTGDVSATGDVIVTGDGSFGGDLDVTGLATVGSLKIGNRELFKQLYSDSTGWSTGDLTVAGLSDYSLFLVKCSDGLANMLCSISNDGTNSYLRGIGGYPNTNSQETRFYLSASLSGNTLTMEYCRSLRGSGTRTNRTVTEIIGII